MVSAFFLHLRLLQFKLRITQAIAEGEEGIGEVTIGAALFLFFLYYLLVSDKS